MTYIIFTAVTSFQCIQNNNMQVITVYNLCKHSVSPQSGLRGKYNNSALLLLFLLCHTAARDGYFIIKLSV